jgi:hypothetical protein
MRFFIVSCHCGGRNLSHSKDLTSPKKEHTPLRLLFLFTYQDDPGAIGKRVILWTAAYCKASLWVISANPISHTQPQDNFCCTLFCTFAHSTHTRFFALPRTCCARLYLGPLRCGGIVTTAFRDWIRQFYMGEGLTFAT